MEKYCKSTPNLNRKLISSTRKEALWSGSSKRYCKKLDLQSTPTSFRLWSTADWSKSYSAQNLLVKLDLRYIGRSLFCDFNQFFDLVVCEGSGFSLGNHQQLYVFVARLHHVQESLYNQLQAVLVADVITIVLLQKLAHLLRIAPTGLSLPLRKRASRICVIQMRLPWVIESRNQARYSKGPDSTLLSVFLLGFCDEFGHVLNWGTVVVVQSIALAFNSCLVGQDTAVSSQTRVGHVYVVIKLNNLLDSFAFLQFSDSLFLSATKDTSTARITEELVMSPTAHNPFLTA